MPLFDCVSFGRMLRKLGPARKMRGSRTARSRRASGGVLGCRPGARSIERTVTVDRPTRNSSASSAAVYSPVACAATRRASSLGVSLGCSPFRRPLALAIFMPSRVRARMRSASNSAIIARTLNSSRPTGSVGSDRPAERGRDAALGEFVGDPCASRIDRSRRSKFWSRGARRPRAARTGRGGTPVSPAST